MRLGVVTCCAVAQRPAVKRAGPMWSGPELASLYFFKGCVPNGDKEQRCTPSVPKENVVYA